MNDIEIAQAVSTILSKFTKATPDEAPATSEAARVDGLDEIVAKVLARHSSMRDASAIPQVAKVANASAGAFDTMDEAISAAVLAQVQYRHRSMQDRASFINGIRDVFLQEDVLCALSRMAVEETDMGNHEDKLIKNRVAALKTPGIEDLITNAVSGDGGLTLIEYSAFGVIGSIASTTNLTETIINSSIGMLAADNTVVFSPHLHSRRVSLYVVELIDNKLAQLDAPANMVVTVIKPSIDNTNVLINDPRINMLVATDGLAVVKTVVSSGKKVIGAGAGNPPAAVGETVDIEKAARDIIKGCSFDDNLPCVAEKEVIVVSQVVDYLIHCMKKSGAYLLCSKKLSQQLQSLVLSEKDTRPNIAFVGKDACCILQQLGIQVGDDIKVILIEAERIYSLVVHGLMMPILPVVRVDDVDEVIELAIEAEHGNRHTVIMHSTNVEKLTKMTRLIQTTIFVKNGPSYIGLGVGGEGHATFTIAGSTGEGLMSVCSFARRRRCVMVEALNTR